MGPTPSDCKHTRREIVKTVGKEEGTLFYTEFADWKCLDCLTNSNPTVLRIEQMKGNLTGHVYSEKVHSPYERYGNCDHRTFSVVRSSVHEETFHEKSFEDILLRNSGNYIWNVATAECVRCSVKFKVRCPFRKESYWVDYKNVKTSVPSEQWEIIYETKREEIESKKPVYVK